MKNAASFMRLALSIIDEAQKDQAAAFSKIKPAVAEARQRLNTIICGWPSFRNNLAKRRKWKLSHRLHRLDLPTISTPENQ